MDFVEMLRMRDEHRRKRHVETLSSQRDKEKGTGGVRGEREAPVEMLRDTENDNMKCCMDVTSPLASERDKQVLFSRSGTVLLVVHQ